MTCASSQPANKVSADNRNDGFWVPPLGDHLYKNINLQVFIYTCLYIDPYIYIYIYIHVHVYGGKLQPLVSKTTMTTSAAFIFFPTSQFSYCLFTPSRICSPFAHFCSYSILHEFWKDPWLYRGSCIGSQLL